MLKTQHSLLALIACLVLTAGCQQQANNNAEQLAEARKQYVLAEEPTGVEGVLDIQESYSEPRDVVLVGKIGGVDNPWTRGKASFVLSDPVVFAEAEDAAAEHLCNDTSCKFCEKKKADKNLEGRAVVHFKDDQGKILLLDAQQLFDLKEKQTVVVRGHAEIDDQGLLIVSAKGLYIRK